MKEHIPLTKDTQSLHRIAPMCVWQPTHPRKLPSYISRLSCQIWWLEVKRLRIHDPKITHHGGGSYRLKAIIPFWNREVQVYSPIDGLTGRDTHRLDDTRFRFHTIQSVSRASGWRQTRRSRHTSNDDASRRRPSSAVGNRTGQATVKSAPW